MQHFDIDFVNDVLKRLEKLPPSAQPRWGELRRDTLIEHFIWVIRHAMGRSRQVPYFGNWFTCRIVGPLYLRGWLPTPKNLKFPKRLAAQGVTGREPGDLIALRALLEEYLNLAQADELTPAPHPIFGNIGVDGWDRLHVRHFRYHLDQFGA